MRRAAIPFKMTAGFHPAPRLVFALSLSLGIVGRNEVVELELTEPRESADVLAAFRNQAPKGWNFHSVRVVPMKASAVARRIVYRLELPDDRIESVLAKAESLMASKEVWVDRYHPKPRQVDIRQYLRAIEVRTSEPGALATGEIQSTGTPVAYAPGSDGSVRFDIWVTATGTARADELLKLLRIDDLLDAGRVLERAELELVDETPPDATDAPPTGPAITRRLELPSGALPDDDEPSPTAPWGLSPSGPVVE